MEEKRKFEKELEAILTHLCPLLQQDILSGEECQQYLEEIDKFWEELFFLPQEIMVQVDEHNRGFSFVRTYLKEGKKSVQLSHVPFDTVQASRGKELVQLTKLLIMETLDEYFACTLARTMEGNLQLDQLLCYQEGEYSILKRMLQGEDNSN